MSAEEAMKHLDAAIAELKNAEGEIDCAWCKSHVTGVRVLAEDLLHLARLNIDLENNQDAQNLLRKIGTRAENSGILALVARIIHRVKGLKY